MVVCIQAQAGISRTITLFSIFHLLQILFLIQRDAGARCLVLITARREKVTGTEVPLHPTAAALSTSANLQRPLMQIEPLAIFWLQHLSCGAAAAAAAEVTRRAADSVVCHRCERLTGVHGNVLHSYQTPPPNAVTWGLSGTFLCFSLFSGQHLWRSCSCLTHPVPPSSTTQPKRSESAVEKRPRYSALCLFFVFLSSRQSEFFMFFSVNIHLLDDILSRFNPPPIIIHSQMVSSSHMNRSSCNKFPNLIFPCQGRMSSDKDNAFDVTLPLRNSLNSVTGTKLSSNIQLLLLQLRTCTRILSKTETLWFHTETLHVA